MTLKWKKDPGSSVQAPISHGGSSHDYVISHRPDQHTVSYRPAGKHVHVGTFTTEKEAKAAAVAHAKAGSPVPEAPTLMPPRRTSTAAPRRGRKKQIEREIAASLSARGEPQLAAMFSDPEARRTFAQEMRHAIYKKQATASFEASKVERPWSVKHAVMKDLADGTRRQVREGFDP